MSSTNAEKPLPGLKKAQLQSFLETDTSLQLAIAEADALRPKLLAEFPELKDLAEGDLLNVLQQDFVNFYAKDTVCPFTPIAARGPWMVGLDGAVYYEAGGYGMLGHGHAPQEVLDVLSGPYPMTNIMTPSIWQYKLGKLLKEKIGLRRPGKACPYEKFISMNSGSEANSVACRIAGTYAKKLSDPGAEFHGKKLRLLSLTGGFHGRTERPAQASSSSQKNYAHVSFFRDNPVLDTVAPNDEAALRLRFEEAEKENVHYELMFLEPVMGEGNPGFAISPSFYALARELTKKHKTMLVVDSIQAGLRAQGVLSITDYQGFENLEGPDMESFSKAISAGQYPISILAMNEFAASQYKTGTYGNTMTATPRGLAVACEVLAKVDESLRQNVIERGKEFLEKLESLQKRMPDIITQVEGSGLLVAAHLRKDIPVVGANGVETMMRRLGVNVIHGGENALRYTPRFLISSEEIDLIVKVTGEALELFSLQK